MTDRETIAVYDARAQEYHDRFGSPAPGAALRAFMEMLPAEGRVLDLGCGPGHSAAHLASAGFEVDAIDASTEMVRLAQAQPGVTAWHATFDDLDAVAHYDGIWCNFALLHAPRPAMNDHLTAIALALKPGGAFHIGMKTGTDTQRDGIGRNYTFYTQDDLTARLAAVGLNVIASETGSEKGLAGTVDPWVILRARRDA